MPTLVQTGYGERPGQAPRVPGLGKPLGTVVAGGQKHGLVSALITKHYGGVVGHAPQLTLGTITGQDHHALTTASLRSAEPGRADDDGRSSRAEQVRAFLIAYYSNGNTQRSQQQSLFQPLHTITAKARFGLVTVAGEAYEIADIGMRMLAPHELFAAQGFPQSYALAPHYQGRALTKTAQIRLAGNSVCPQLAEAIVRANFTGGAAQKAVA